MIPGTGALGRKKPPISIGLGDERKVKHINRVAPSRPTSRWGWALWLLPRPRTADRFSLYQLVISDLIVLSAVNFVPSLFVFKWALQPVSVPTFAVLVTLFAYSEGLYEETSELTQRLFALARSVLYAMACILIVAWEHIHLRTALLASVCSFIGLVAWRRLLKWRSQIIEQSRRNVLIVGATPMGRTIARALRNDAGHGYSVRGFVDNYAPISSEVLGRIKDLDWLARSEFVDEVIVTLPVHSPPAREATQVAYDNRLDIRAVPDLPAGTWPDARIERVGGIPIVTLHREPVPSPELFVKRLVDGIGALVALVLTAPILALVAIAIRLDSRGPILYVAERTGTKGKRFRCYKFRSMVADADRRKESLLARNQRQGPIFKIVDDPRTTRVGRFIRRYSLDELPQLWNVLRGDMSLVGPRPHPVEEVHKYELHHYRRLDVRPGLTGLWQVTARQNPSFDLNMHLDLTYIENWTVMLDLQILLRTVRVLFSPEGA